MSERSPAEPTLQIENERVRVIKWSFVPGATTGWHRHEYDYVIVPLVTGKLLLREPGGTERIAELTLGTPYFRQEGVEHEVINANDFPFAFIEVELKQQPPNGQPEAHG